MKISIITINYNDAAGLEKTLESIIPHKVSDIELLVIDGGSTDMSIDVIHEHKDYIDYWISEHDRGIYHAMNKGIEQAKGEYVMFINSGDDLMSNVNFDQILSSIDGTDIIYHNLEIVEGENRSIKTYPDKLDFKYFVEDSLPHTSTLIKKELFEKYGLYSEDFRIIADWAFFMDCILLHNCSYRHIDSCFASFYLGGLSSQPHNFGKLMAEQDKHIAQSYPLYNSLYLEWKEKKNELYKLKTAKSVQYLKKAGFLKWLNIE